MKFIFSLLFSFLVSTPLYALQVRILDVHDGDTLTAIGTQDSVKYKIRLMGVDTPEVDFFKHSQGEAAEKAREALVNYLPKGSIVTISDDSDIDKHGRILGRIFKDNIDINKEMLRDGWGFFYFIAPFEKRTVMAYSEAAREAYEGRRGIFADNTEEPYLFRMRVRKQVGKNLIGDLESKKLFNPEDINQVPAWRRVFFSDSFSAKNLGYH